MPEDSVSVNDKHINQLGLGYAVSFLNNKLFLKQTGSYSKLENPLHEYFGIITDTAISYQNQAFYSNLYLSNNDTYLERNNKHGAEIATSIKQIKNTDASIRLKYDHHAMDTYHFNTKEDRSERDEYLASLKFSYKITEDLDFTIENQGNYRRLNFEENLSRNNRYYENNFTYQINYKYIFGDYFARLNLLNNSRYFRLNNQSRDSAEKQFTLGGLWTTTLADTLRFEVGNSLLQNFHSGTFNTLDNDRVMTSYTLLLINNFWNNTIKNTFQFFQGQQIYIDKTMSANNHEIQNYHWTPEAELYLNQYFKLYNKYTLRAYYENFIYIDFLNDRFYRNITAEWGIRFLDKYIQVNNQKTGVLYDYFDVYAAFILEHSENAEKLEDIWYKNNSEYIRKYLISMEYYKNNFHLRLMPILYYFQSSIESEVQIDLNMILGDLTLNTSINPIGRQYNKTIWRFNFNLMYNW